MHRGHTCKLLICTAIMHGANAATGVWWDVAHKPRPHQERYDMHSSSVQGTLALDGQTLGLWWSRIRLSNPPEL